MTPVSIGVIGAGLFGRKHMDVMRQEPACRLAAIADPTPEARAYAESLDVPCFADYEEMLDRVRPQAAIIATPNVLHVPAGIACAERGVPMLVEKPIADTVELACELLREAKRANVRILVGHHRRYHAQAQEARRIVGGGRLGRLVAVTALWATRKPDPYFDAAWRRTTGGGPILINLIHEIDMLRYVGGELASVAGVTSHAMRGFEVEDTAAATFAYAGGALGTVLCTDAAVSPWTIEQGLGENPAFPYTGENGFRFLGTAGALEFPQLKVWSSRDPAKVGWDQLLASEPVRVVDRDVYAEQIRHLRAVVEGREAPVVSGADGARTLAATLAVHESARTRAPVDLARDYAAIDAAER